MSVTPTCVSAREAACRPSLKHRCALGHDAPHPREVALKPPALANQN